MKEISLKQLNIEYIDGNDLTQLVLLNNLWYKLPNVPIWLKWCFVKWLNGEISIDEKD